MTDKGPSQEAIEAVQMDLERFFAYPVSRVAAERAILAYHKHLKRKGLKVTSNEMLQDGIDPLANIYGPDGVNQWKRRWQELHDAAPEGYG